MRVDIIYYGYLEIISKILIPTNTKMGTVNFRGHTGVYALCDQSFRWDVFQLIKDIKNYHFCMNIRVIHLCTLISIMDISIL